MRIIDMQTWSRRNHFKFFNSLNHPHFSMCVNMDVTTFYPFVKRNEYSLTVSIAYLISRVANEIPEFKYRIRGEQVIEHEKVNPSFTILIDEDIFSFCDVEYVNHFSEFANTAAKQIAEVKKQPNLDDSPGDDALYMSAIPWVSFTNFTHPMQLHPTDSVPRFAWGKIFKENDVLKMPLNVQGHHAVMDGIHMGRFYEKAQEYLHQPQSLLGVIDNS